VNTQDAAHAQVSNEHNIHIASQAVLV